MVKRKNKDKELLGKQFIFLKKENCCGCTACFASCPAGAISMVKDQEGFKYPVIDEEKCVKCFKCIDVCGFKEAQKKRGFL